MKDFEEDKNECNDLIKAYEDNIAYLYSDIDILSNSNISFKIIRLVTLMFTLMLMLKEMLR